LPTKVTELTAGAEALIFGSLLVGIRWLTEPETPAGGRDAEPSPWARGRERSDLEAVRPLAGDTGRRQPVPAPREVKADRAGAAQ
jgi:hypothetical protein